MNVTADFVYQLFSDIYYTKEFPVYTDRECSTTEAIQCLLKSFFTRKVTRRMADSKIVILSFGDLVHMALREPLQKRKYDTEVENATNLGRYMLWSHMDTGNKVHGMEFKTISRRPHQILTHHFLQGNTYYHVNKLESFDVVYIHKPSGLVFPFPLQPHKDSYDFVTRRATRLCWCLEHNVMPEAEPSWLCQYCEYVDLCPTPQRSVRGGFY